MTMTEFAHVKRMIAKGDIARATQLLNEILESEATDVRAKKLCGVLFMKMENMDRFDEIRHGQRNKKVLRNLWYQLCDDGGYVIFNASAMMEYVVVALIILLACVWGWEAWGWNGLSFVLFGVMFLGALVYVVGSVSAYFSRRHETINGYKWTYAIFDGRVKVAAFSPHSGAISIPATLGHCPVTSIEQGVFSGCRDLTGVAIPSSVTT